MDDVFVSLFMKLIKYLSLITGLTYESMNS